VTLQTDTQAVAIARSLDFLLEEEVCILAKIKEGTAEAWRKHHKGPPYALIGNRYLYPKAGVAAWLEQQTRRQATSAAASAL